MKTKWPLGLILSLGIGLIGCSSSSSTNAPGVTISPPSVTVDEEGPTSTTYTLVLVVAPIADVTVTITPDSEVTVSPTNLVFTTANWDSALSVTVTAVDDALAEGFQPHTSIITHTATSDDDPQYDGLAISAVTVSVTDNDTVGVTITDSDGVVITPTEGSIDVTEGGATDTYTVVLVTEPRADVTIALSIPDGETSVSLTSLTWTTANWNIAQTVTVSAVDDNLAEGLLPRPSTITHTVASGDPRYDGFAISAVTVSVTDNDAAGVSITETSASTDVTEGGVTDTYTVVLDTQPTADVTITISISEVPAQTTVSVTPLTFTTSNWNTAQTVTVTAVDDFVFEGTHTSTITHSLGSSADPNYDSATATITIAGVVANVTDNDVAGVTITESSGSTDVIEATPPGPADTDTYEIVLNTQPTADVTITIAPDTQTTVSPTSLTFTTANWNTAQTVTVTAVDDAVAEGSHASTITHAIDTVATTASEYDPVTIADLVANITDNDVAGVTFVESFGSSDVFENGATDDYTVVLNTEPTADVTITITPDAQSTVSPSSLTFTPVNWSGPQEVIVTAVDDAVAEGSHASTITHGLGISSDLNYTTAAFTIADVVANVTDNDTAGVTIVESFGSTDVAEGGLTDSYTVSLTSEPAGDVVIVVSVTEVPRQSDVDGSASTTVTLTAANWIAGVTVNVVAVDDAGADGTLASTITHVIDTVATTANEYDGFILPNVIVTVTDNDVPGVTIVESSTSTDVVEGGTTDSYTVELNTQPTADVTITISISEVPAQTSVSVTTLTFTTTDWSTEQTVIVTAVDDSFDEGGLHPSTIAHVTSSSDGAYDGLAFNVTANVTDNDVAGVTITPTSFSLTEGGATDTYDVVLTSEPTDDVTISLSISEVPAQTTVSSATLTFNTSNWNTPQTVTVTAINDGALEIAHTSTINHSLGISGDSNYDTGAFTIDDVTVNIADFNTILGISIGTPTSDDVTVAGERDYWVFAAMAGQVLAVEIHATRNAQATWATNVPRLILYDTDGVAKRHQHTYASSSGWGQGKHDLDLYSVRIPTTGNYFLEVTQDNAAAPGGPYILYIKELMAPGTYQTESEGEMEIPSINEAWDDSDVDVITPGTIYGFYTDDESDFYKFKVDNESIIAVQLVARRSGRYKAESVYARLKMNIYDPSGTLLLITNESGTGFDPGQFYNAITTTGSDYYYLEITERTGSVGSMPYFIDFSLIPTTSPIPEGVEPNNPEANATTVSYGDVITGAIVLGADQDDYFKFTAQAGDWVHINVFDGFNYEGATDLVDIQMRIEDLPLNPGTYIDAKFSQTYFSSSVLSLSYQVLRFIPAQDGDYYIRISPAGLATTYSLYLSLMRRGEFETDSAPTNNTIADADDFGTDPVTGLQSATGRIDPTGDIDIFKFTANAGELVSINCTARNQSPLDQINYSFLDIPPFGLAPMKPTLVIKDSVPTTLVTSSYDASTLVPGGDVQARGLRDNVTSTSASFLVPSDGTYYIEVTDQTGTGSADHFYFLEMRTEGP